MKKILHSFTLLLVACCLLGGLQSAYASHIQGGQITYRYVTGDTYEVTVSFYRDCSPGAAPVPGSVDITAVSSCNGSGTTVRATLLPVVGTLTIGQGYCPSIQVLATCNPGSSQYPNYEKQDYRGTINLPPAPNWIISHQSCCRPSTANIPTQDDFRFEATLNNQVSVNGVLTRVNNSSPLFSSRDFPVPFVLVNQRTSINFTAASEADGDSLVYELDRPLANCGEFNPYSARPTGISSGCVTRILPPRAPNTVCLLDCGPNVGGPDYTANLPLPVANDTVGVCGTVAGTAYTRTVVPRFSFNPRIGEFTFTPNLFRPGTTTQGLNKYVVVGKITEYRRLPGSNRRYRVGSVRRDFLVIIIDGAGNQVPSTPVITVPDPLSGAVPVNRPDTTLIRINTCNYAQVRVLFTDPNNTAATPPAARQNLTVTYTGTGTINGDLLQGGDVGVYTLLRNGTPTPEARFYFQPGAFFAGQVIRIPLRIEDDACPIKGVQTRVIEIRIVEGRTAQAVAAGGQSNVLPGVVPTTICGGTLNLTGNVLRPDSVRQLAANRTVLQTYGFQWTQVRGNGLPTVSNGQNITVSPTITSRYHLRITPLQGFGTNGGGCGDTTSILVRVAPTVANAFTIPSVISGRNNSQVTIPGQTAVPPLTFVLSNTTPQPAATSGFQLCGISWTYQRVKDGAGNLLASAPVEFSTAYQPVETALKLSLGGEYVIRLASNVAVRGGACTTNAPSCPATVAQRIVIVPELSVPNIITPNNDNLNDVFVLPVAQRGGKLELYNRWGRKVQEYANYQNTWAGGDQPDGVYYYYITDPSGNKTKGWVEVRRGL